MNAEAVRAHRDTILAWEIEQAEGPSGKSQRKKQANGSIRTALDSFAEMGGTHSNPMPSHEVLSGVFRNLETGRGATREQKAEFIAQWALPLTRSDQGQPAAQVDIKYALKDSCSDAEVNFAKAATQIAELAAGQKPRKHRIVSVYTDETDTPIALRKNAGSSTALLLAAASDTGTDIVLPAGTIVGIDHDASDLEELGSFSAHKTGNYGVRAYRAAGNLGVSPLRLSPWAYTNPLDRALFATSNYGFSQDRANLVTGLELADFQRAAGQILDLCASGQ